MALSYTAQETDLADLEWGLEPHGKPIALEMRRNHHPMFERCVIVKAVLSQQLNGIDHLPYATFLHLKVQLERKMFAQIDAIPDKRLEELWDAAAMDFVLNRHDAAGFLWGPTGEVMTIFWGRCIAPPPSCKEFPALKKPPLVPFRTHPDAWYEKATLWPKLRKEWLELAKWPQSS